MNESELTRSMVLGCTIFLSALLIMTNYHIKKRYMQTVSPTEIVAEQSYVQSWDKNNGTFKLACMMLNLPVVEKQQGSGVQPNMSLQAECQIQGNSTTEYAITVTPYVAE